MGEVNKKSPVLKTETAQRLKFVARTKDRSVYFPLAHNLKKNYSLDFNESVLLLMQWELETWRIISAFVLR